MEPVIVVDNFLSAEEIAEYCCLIDKQRNTANNISRRETLKDEFWTRHGARCRELGVADLKSQVTLSSNTKHLDWHRDPVFGGETHKLLIYLNAFPEGAGGGTLFKIPGISGVQRIAPRPGRLVIFDIRLEHAGEPFPAGMAKYSIGFRGCARSDLELKVASSGKAAE